MEQNNEQLNIEEKLKIENEIVNSKRELKLVTSQLNDAKKEINDIASLKERNLKLIEEQNRYLKEVMNDISQMKLDWAQEKNKEVEEIESKSAEVQNVLNRKAELNEQEETIRQINAKNIDTLNELRRLELKLTEDATAVDAKKSAMVVFKKEIDAEHEKNEKKIREFKESILTVMAQVESI